MGRPLLRSLPAFVIAAVAVYTYSVYTTLPAQIPTHWGVNGQPNGWSSREFGAWLLPGMMLVLFAMFRVLPKVDPRKANYDKFGVPYELATTSVLVFMAVIQYVMLSVAQGRAVDINTVIYVGLGSLFVILGAAMPFTKPTWFFGIRTPWTMSDDTVWARTHKVGGFLMLASGVLTIYTALTAPPPAPLIAVIAGSIAATLGSVLLSYIYWRQR